jgi:DNA polymerase-3 subunit delta'
MLSETNPELLWPRVIGQERVKRILVRAIASGRLPHALLFDGGEGVGKDAMALELARVLHCENGGVNACGTCGSCVRMERLQHPDVRLITALPVGKGEKSEDPPLARLTGDEVLAIQEEYRKKGENPYYRISLPRANVIKINSIREVRRESAMATSAGRRRVFIISRAEEMNDEASNTILKTLEEPAGDSLLILTSAQPDALLPTIRSRCQRIRFDLLTEEEIAGALLARRGTPVERATLVARLAEGSFARATGLLEEDLAREGEEVVAFIRSALAGNASGVIDVAERRGGSKDRDEARRFLLLMLHWFRDALVVTSGGPAPSPGGNSDIEKFIARFPHAHLPGVLNAVERSLSLLERNVYIKLIFLHLAVRLRHLILPGAAAQSVPGPATM